MAYCGPRGIPLTDFLAWPEESQQAALQWHAHEAARCSGCGTHREDWWDDGALATPQHWHPEVCLGCQAKQRAAAALRSDNDETRGLGLVAAQGPARACPVCTG